MSAGKSVYGGVFQRLVQGATLCALGLFASVTVLAATPPAQPLAGMSTILDARDALRKKDRGRLLALRAAAASEANPLAMWVDYWELSNRLNEATQDELESFYTRWAGTYVEDRLRNDWLLELGRRRDWANFAVDYPRFRMNDDREVTCYAVMLEQQSGKDVRDAARSAWYEQRDADEGCALMAATLYAAGQFTAADVWRKVRLTTDANKPRSARQAAGLLGPKVASAVGEIFDNPARFLARRGSAVDRTAAELTTLSLIRMAANDPQVAADALQTRWHRGLPSDLASWAWASAGRQSALKLTAEAPLYYQNAEVLKGREDEWPDDTLAWKVRSALRANNGAGRWQQVTQAINAMSVSEQRDPAWIYWKARALLALAGDSQESASVRTEATDLLNSIAGQMHFYGKLASEQLGQPVLIPPKPQALTVDERDAAYRNPGLARGLQLIAIGLRGEGVREWNYSLRGMSDRQLLAAAQLACDKEVWDRCINTSDRTKVEIDIEQRFPTPFRRQVVARSREIGLDPAYVYGLIRQESRFIMDARSGVGASGLMQIMPGTALWTAKKIGLDYTHALIADRDVNLKLGTSYLKLVLDDFAGSQPMAAAAYNAGPGRPRRWREGPLLDPAAWAENIPFSETRDYVKKVLSNATYYSAIVNATGQTPSLKARLGPQIGPRVGPPPDIEKDMP
ncbi:MAG: lytic transglycosylase [Rhizobacter sp.]|nr:lytic transglycosylase [Rhizobacter sp.]